MIAGGPDDDPELDAFLAQYSAYYSDASENGGPRRVRCLVTGHEMPRKLAAVKPHFLGRRFKSKVDKWKPNFDYAQYEPHIVPDRSNPKHFLFCRLTHSVLPRLPLVVEAHVNGRKFKQAMTIEQVEGDADELPDGDEMEIDQDELPEFMRDDADLMRGDEEQEEVEEEPPSRRLVQLEEDMPVFQGRKKKKRTGS
jgi:hypothetical protein